MSKIMKNLPELLEDLNDFDVLSTSIELKCQGDDCAEYLTYHRGCEAIEINELVAEACDLYSWDAERILCECCAKKADDIAAEDAHWIEKQEQEREDAA